MSFGALLCKKNYVNFQGMIYENLFQDHHQLMLLGHYDVNMCIRTNMMREESSPGTKQDLLLKGIRKLKVFLLMKRLLQ